MPRVLVFPLGSGGGPGTVVSARTRLAEYASYCGEHKMLDTQTDDAGLMMLNTQLPSARIGARAGHWLSRHGRR